MTVFIQEGVVMLEGACTVEDAEVLAEQLQQAAVAVDWSACTHLHAACFQLLLAAGLPVRGSPANPALARWLQPLVAAPASTPAAADPLR